MKLIFDKYLINITIITAVLIVAFLIWNYFLPDFAAAPWWPFFVSFFYLITILIHALLTSGLKKNPNRFIGLFLGVTLGKLILFMVVLLLNVIFAPFEKVSVIVPFLVLYLVYTIYEVKVLSARSVKKKSSE